MTDRRTGYSEQNKQAWDKLYRRTEGEVWGRNPIPFVDEFINGSADSMDPTSRLLDAAAGEGRHVPNLQKLPGQVYATDSSLHALEKMAAIPGGVNRVHCDLVATPFEENFFDLALLIDAVETLPNIDQVLEEVWRILKPGARLLCNIPGKEDGISSENMHQAANEDPSFLYQGVYYYRFYTEEEAIELVGRHGFEVVRNELRTWTEKPHPGFREKEHSHTSRVFLLAKPLG